MTHRWMKFWPADWQSDPALRMCSLAARGLWMEVICLAHAAEPYGHLLVNGKPVTSRQIAVLVGSTPKEVEALMRELEEAGVFSRTEAGAIYSRRMVRDKAASDAGRASGKAGGNPALKGARASPDNGGGYEGGLTPPLKLEAEAEAEAEKNPLTPTAGAAGGLKSIEEQRRPPRGSRAAGTNPRAVAAAERAAAPPPPEPDGPMWPAFRARGMPPSEFRRWIAPLVRADGIDGRAVLVAPTRFHADHVRREFGPHLEAACGGPVDVREAPGVAAHG